MAKGVLPIVVWRGEVVVSWEVRRGTGELVSNRGLHWIERGANRLTTEKLRIGQQSDEM
jgi:hypothetical protein